MKTSRATPRRLRAENAELRARLAEAQEALRAIREGEVDAVIVTGSKGDRVFALSEAENLHRLMVETMNEAGLATTLDGTLMFCNDRAAALLGRPKDELLGRDVAEFLHPKDRPRFQRLLQAAQTGNADERLLFLHGDGKSVPMHVWASHLQRTDGPLICLVATDLSVLEADRSFIAELQEQQQPLRDARRAALNLMEDAVSARQQAEQSASALRESQAALREARDKLELRVRERTRQLADVNEQLQTALSVMNDLYHGAPCGYHSLDRTGQFVEINDTALQWLGYQREELVGKKTVFELLHPTSRQAGLLSFDLLGRGQSVHDVQLELVRKGGSVLTVFLNATPILDEAGQLARTRSAYVDITGRARAERALAHSEQRLQAILDFSPAVIFLKDLQGHYTLVNREFERLVGKDQGQVVGRTDADLFPTEQAGEFQANDRSVLHAGRPLAFEETVRYRDGDHMNAVVKFPLRDMNGKVHALGGIAIDITARMEAEAALRASEIRFRGFVESAPDAVVIVDARGRIQLVNAQTERMFGYPRAELLNGPLERLMPGRFRKGHVTHRGDFFAEPRIRAMGSGLALFGRRKDGTEFPIEISLSPLPAASGTLVCAAVRDITVRKRIEDALRKSKEHYLALFKEAREAHARLQKLSGLVLHAQEKERKRISRELHDEVGQALTAVSLTLKGIALNGAPDSAGNQLKLEQAQRLLQGAMESAHDFSRELRPSVLDELGLLPALRSTVERVAERTGMQVRLRADPQAEQLSDEKKLVLFRITQESLNNVVKHAQASRANVTLSRTAEGITLSVTDNGKSFQPAQDGAVTRGRLGLLGMRERVRLVNGKFGIRARPGKGTTVRVLLPLEPPRPASPTFATPKPRSAVPSESPHEVVTSSS